jgi:hypothetical protein
MRYVTVVIGWQWVRVGLGGQRDVSGVHDTTMLALGLE